MPSTLLGVLCPVNLCSYIRAKLMKVISCLTILICSPMYHMPRKNKSPLNKKVYKICTNVLAEVKTSLPE